ncbi:MAG: hypothetical protein KDE46_24170, partial [Caldilineaceae bacterium]|nr:hypothetical protein [Caldilineaceae bacterium]
MPVSPVIHWRCVNRRQLVADNLMNLPHSHAVAIYRFYIGQSVFDTLTLTHLYFTHRNYEPVTESEDFGA